MANLNATGTFPSTVINSKNGPQVPIFPASSSIAGNATSGVLTGTTSATYVMVGLGALGWTITPQFYGTLKATVDGAISNTSASAASGVATIIAYGTGAAPANGAAATGTTVGVNTVYYPLAGQTAAGVPFAKSYTVSGLTAGTAYWFDLQILSQSTGTASVTNVEYTLQELSN